jgi:predicted ATP-grasp superfamily ATP-dependent carboligase
MPAILIPSTDTAALLVADHASSLREQFRFPIIPAELAHALCSKKEMYYLAEGMGIPTPLTGFPSSRRDVLKFTQDARFPIIVKPIEADKAKSQVGRQKAVVSGRKQLLERYDSLESVDQSNLVLQEYIPGADEASWMFNGYFDQNSKCLFGMTGRKIRQHRPHAGITSLGVCEPNEAVAEITTRLTSAIGYRGILDIGYRYDARDGQYKVFDINPRIGCTFRLFVNANGMDVVRAMYLDLSGERVPAADFEAGRKWVVEDLDLASSFRSWRAGELRLREWVRSLGGFRETALFARDDARPIVRLVTNHLRHFLRRDRNRAVGHQTAPTRAITLLDSSQNAGD